MGFEFTAQPATRFSDDAEMASLRERLAIIQDADEDSDTRADLISDVFRTHGLIAA